MGGGHDRRMGDGGGIGHIRSRAEVEAAGQRHRVGDRVVGRAERLDDVRGAAALAGRAGEQLIVSAAAVQRVDTAAAAQDVRVGVTRDRVRMGRAEHLFDARQRVGARATRGHAGREVDRDAADGIGVVGDVVTGAAVQGIGAAAAYQVIVAVAAIEHVVAGTAVQHVSAGQAVDGVISAEAADGVAEGGAGDGLVGDVASNPQAARGRRGDGLGGELQELDVADGDGLAEARDRPDLTVPGDHIVGAGAGEHHRIRAQAAVDLVVAAVAGDDVGRGVAPNGVGARAADHVLDHRAHGDGDVSGQSPDAGEGALPQVDRLGDPVAREVEGVRAPRVPDREDQGAQAGVGIEPGLAGVGVEAIDRIPGPRRRIGAVQPLRRGDVVEQRHSRITTAQITARIGFAEIAHHRVLARILKIGRAAVVGDRAARARVVGGRVAQADGVPDFVQQHLLSIGLHHRIGVVGQ